MSIFTQKGLSLDGSQLSSLNIVKDTLPYLAMVPSIFIFFEDMEECTDLPLPKKGRKFISSKLGDLRYIQGEQDILVFGGGSFNPKKHVSKDQYLMSVGAKLYDALKKENIQTCNWLKLPHHKLFGPIIYGMYVRSFNNGSNFNPIEIERVSYVGKDCHDKWQAAAYGTNFTRALINTPFGVHDGKGNQTGLTVESFTKLLQKKFKGNAKFYSADSLNAGGLASVSRGSTQDACLVEVTHCHPDCKDNAPVVYVVKGMMYDSGGAAVKTPNGMKDMKYDMSAAAVAAGMLETLRLSNAKCHVKVVFCLAENAIGPDMVYNGDHVVMMDGKVVHNTNTDAEGRMVLYDGLVYAQEFIPNARYYITMGTLTGLGKMMFKGRSVLGFTQNQKLKHFIKATNEKTGRVNDIFMMPDDPRTDDAVKSAEPGVDLINSNQDTVANGTEYCYKFIKAAMTEGNLDKFAHIDLGGGIVFDKKDITGEPLPYASGTGFGVLFTEAFTRSLG